MVMRKLKKSFLGRCPVSYWLVGFLLIVAAWLLIVRLVVDEGEGVHYHANFQIYVHGQLLALDNPIYYEEDSACSEDASGLPLSRVHMHDQVPHLIHVHDQAVTYSHFMSNLGFSLSDHVLEVDDGVYVDGREGELRFILNGQRVFEVANKVIQSEDVLLIDYSPLDFSDLEKYYEQIPKDAAEANLAQDPTGCAGDASSLSFWTKLKQAFGF